MDLIVCGILIIVLFALTLTETKIKCVKNKLGTNQFTKGDAVSSKKGLTTKKSL